MSGSRRKGWLVVLAVAAGIGVYYYATATHGIDDALKSESVSAEIREDSDGSVATITLTRTGSGSMTVVVPAGTILEGGSEVQRVITGRALRFALSSAVPSVTARVQTFCIDEFSALPGSGSPYTFARAGENSYTSRSTADSMQKIGGCLESSPVADHDKQLAVWAIKDDWLHKTPDEALKSLTSQFEQQIMKEQRAKLDGEGRRQIHENHPVLTDAQIDTLIEREMQDESADLRERAAKKAEEQLEAFRSHDKDLLLSCGYSPNSLPLFN